MSATPPPCPKCALVGDHFCEPRATRAQSFIEKVCYLSRPNSGHAEPFILREWQKDGIVRPLFGQVKWSNLYKDYVRQYTTAWIEMARKNGKTELQAAIALLLLCADDVINGEIYGAAMDREQAGLVFESALKMVNQSPYLKKQIKVMSATKRLIHLPSGSFYQVIAADAHGALGTNPTAVVFDEVLTQRDQSLWQALKQGFGTRKNQLFIAATTAGNNVTGFAYQEHLYAEKVLAGNIDDPTWLVWMRNTPRDADWQDEANWYFANPALGDFLDLDKLREEFKKAVHNPSQQNYFRQFRLNQWVSQASRWLDMHTWDASAGVVDPEALEGMECFGGLDLASTADWTAWVLVFPKGTEPGYWVLPHFWLPRGALEAKNDMRDSIEAWAREGYVTITDGSAVDYDVVEAHILRDAERFSLREFGFDRWNATQVVQHLEAQAGLMGIQVPQSPARLNAPSKEMERLLSRQELSHGGNPPLRWMADNVELFTTSDGLIKPDKKKSTEKIDGIVALVMALSVAMREREVTPTVQFIDLDQFL